MSTDLVGKDQHYRDWKEWSSESFAQYSAADACYYQNELSKAGVSSLKNLNCLEIGFGNAQFASWAIDNGIRYVGTEMNADLLRLAHDKSIIAFAADIEISKIIEPNSLDLIIAFDVIEHLEIQEILNLLDSSRCCLKDGGYFIARFPSGDSPFSRAIQYGDMTHKSVIGSSMIRQMCVHSGLQIKQVRSPVLPLFGLGIFKFIRRLPIHLLRGLLSRIINLTYNDNNPRVITANMLIVLQKVESH